MGYDGGLSIKIINPEIAKILKKHNGPDLDIGHYLRKRYKGNDLSFYYEYMDCAYVQTCPKTLEEVLECIFELIEDEVESCDGSMDKYYEMRDEMLENEQLILQAYEYIDWRFYPPDTDEDDALIFTFGSITPKKKTKQK